MSLFIRSETKHAFDNRLNAIEVHLEAAKRRKLNGSVVDEILHALRDNPEGMTRNDIMNHFNRHKSSREIKQALAQLLQDGFARFEWRKTPGRRAQVWRVDPQ